MNITQYIEKKWTFFLTAMLLSFSFAQQLTKASSDKTEKFRFNIGTSF